MRAQFRSSIRDFGHLRSAGMLAVALAAWLSASLGAQTPADVASTRSSVLTDGDRIFEPTKLHRVHVSISPAEWAILQTSTANGGPVRGGSEYSLPDGRVVHVGSGFGGVFPWVRADMRVDGGDEFKDVGIRYKGNLSFRSTSAAVPLFANFKLKIDQHGTKGSWDGEKTFNLQAGVVDTSK